MVEVELLGGVYDGEVRMVPRHHVTHRVPLYLAVIQPGTCDLMLGVAGDLLAINVRERVRYSFQPRKLARRHGRWVLVLDAG